VTGSLQKRIKRLERISGGEFETKLRAFSERMGIPAERMRAIAPEHKRWLSQNMGRNGTITWEGFCYLYQLGHLPPGPDHRDRPGACEHG
jgi:hypothetical protein